MQIKTKLEAIASVAVILVALAVGCVVLGRSVSEYRARPVAAGDRLATIPSLDWKQHRRTLVLALNTGCHFCEQSAPFYRSLSERQEHGGSDLDLVAVFPNDPAQVRQFMSHESLRVRSVAAVPLEKLRVNATPTLILIGSDGRVERVWIGMLDPTEQVKLFTTAFGPDTAVQSRNQSRRLKNENFAFARNIAVLFILVMALPGLGLSRQERNKGCTVFSPGSNCSSNPHGDCTISKCNAGQPCSNSESAKNPF